MRSRRSTMTTTSKNVSFLQLFSPLRRQTHASMRSTTLLCSSNVLDFDTNIFTILSNQLFKIHVWLYAEWLTLSTLNTHLFSPSSFPNFFTSISVKLWQHKYSSTKHSKYTKKVNRDFLAWSSINWLQINRKFLHLHHIFFLLMEWLQCGELLIL